MYCIFCGQIRWLTKYNIVFMWVDPLHGRDAGGIMLLHIGLYVRELGYVPIVKMWDSKIAVTVRVEY